MEEIILKPNLEQLKIDKKSEAVKYLVICVAAFLILLLLDASALSIFLPLGFLVIYYKYITIKKSLNYRWIKIREDVVLQDAPGMHVDLKKFPYAVYDSVYLFRGQICFRKGKQKTFIDMNFFGGSINLDGYSEKEKIVYEINERIKEYNF